MGSVGIELLEQVSDSCAGTMECVFVTELESGAFYVKGGEAIGGFLDGSEEPLLRIASGKGIFADDKAMTAAFCGELASLKSPVEEKRYELEFRVMIGEAMKWVRLSCSVACGEDGVPHSILGRMFFMNPAEILKRSLLDKCSVEKNQSFYFNNVKHCIDASDMTDIAFIQFDIVGFRYINRSCGEAVGNEILSYVAEKLGEVCSNESVHFRVNADIFLIVMQYTDDSQIEELIHSVERQIGQYNSIRLRYAFGVYKVIDKSASIREMSDCAAIARKNIKGNALQNIGYYTESLSKSAHSRHFVEDSMDYALESGQFVVYLQPKYSICGNVIVGAEALVRWIHPERGLIPPSEFIPVFEENGFITKLDEYMWEQVCILLRRWMDMGYSPFPISVNVSRVHLRNDKFIADLDNLVEKYGIPKRLLETEITETVENANSGNMIRELKTHGYVLLMDDFGSGYSSLNMLKSTPFDVIKIDREFLNEFMLSERGMKIISHTISMSKDIGLDMVAEGVETKEQADFLCDCGCDIAQGFYYAKPMDVASFERMAFPLMHA